MPLKAGIVIDAWKLSVFQKHLVEANIPFKQMNGPAPNTLSLFAMVDDLKDIERVVKKAQKECARDKAKAENKKGLH